MKMRFHTNLDDLREIDDLNDLYDGPIPPLRALIRFTLHNGRVYQLEVVSVVYDVVDRSWLIELHIPSHLGFSIRDWEEHQKKLRRAEPM